MPSVVIPPWLEAPDTAGEFLKGAQIGASIGAEKARLQEEQARTAMESQVRQQQIQRETMLQQQQLATQQAYRQAQLGLRAQQLQQVEQVNAFKMQNAADQMSQERGFNAAIGGGMSVEDAMIKFPRANPNNVIAARKSDADLAGASLALRQQAFEERKQEFAQEQAKKNQLTSTVDLPIGAGGSQTHVHGTPEEIRAQLGTNTPAELLPRAPVTAPKSPFAEGAVIKSKKDGKTYKVINGVPVAQED